MLRRGGVVCPEVADRFLEADPSRATLHLTEWQAEATVPLQAQAAREYQGRLGELADEVRALTDGGARVFLAGSTPGMRDRFAELLAEYELPVAHGTEPGCRAILLPLGAGVALKDPALWLLTEREVFGPPRRLDEFRRNDGKRVPIEHRLVAPRNLALESLNRAAQNKFSLDVELLRQLALPLLGQMRRTQDGQSPDLTAIEKLSGDERGLHRFADPHVVGNEQAHGVEL